MKNRINLPNLYQDLSIDQMSFINELYFVCLQKIDVKKLKKSLADAAVNADLIYIAMNEMEDLLNDE